MNLREKVRLESQSPAPGEVLDINRKIVVEFEGT